MLEVCTGPFLFGPPRLPPTLNTISLQGCVFLEERGECVRLKLIRRIRT